MLKTTILTGLLFVSIVFNFLFIERLSSIFDPDISYVLEPASGRVWQLDTHSELAAIQNLGTWLSWTQAPLRMETTDSMVLAGHLMPISKECDLRSLNESYQNLQRACLRASSAPYAKTMTLLFENSPTFQPELTIHPVVATVTERLAKSEKQDEYPRLVMPILMTYVESISRTEPLPELKHAVLFRGWAARNFEIAVGR